MTGTIVSFDAPRGGFILCEDGKGAVFFHPTAGKFADLRIGARVAFGVTRDGRGWSHAADVQVIRR